MSDTLIEIFSLVYQNQKYSKYFIKSFIYFLPVLSLFLVSLIAIMGK